MGAAAEVFDAEVAHDNPLWSSVSIAIGTITLRIEPPGAVVQVGRHHLAFSWSNRSELTLKRGGSRSGDRSQRYHRLPDLLGLSYRRSVFAARGADSLQPIRL